MKPSRDISRLIEIMAALRDAETGCPWDVEQDFSTIAPYTIEEAYEVADAIARGDLDDLRDELGDLLLQVVYHAQMAEEAGEFAFGDVVEAITDKDDPPPSACLRRRKGPQRRHGQGHVGKDQGARRRRRSAQPALARGLDPEDHGKGFLDGVPVALPALTRALKLQEKAARVGFDWSEAAPILDKIEEEIGELREAMAKRRRSASIKDEFGDMLFAVVNLGRHLKIDFGSGAERHQRKIPLHASTMSSRRWRIRQARWKRRRWTRWKRSGSKRKAREIS